MSNCQTSSCADCPSKGVCASQSTPFLDDVRENVGRRGVVAVMSGKGGVGKTTVAVAVALLLSREARTCLIDLDITGPSTPRLLGTEENPRINGKIIPIPVTSGLSAVSPLGMETSDKNKVFIDVLTNSMLDNIEFLVIDTPPGTTDEHINMVKYLSLTKVILVSSPQKISIQDVIRQVDYCSKAKIPVVGMVENMKRHRCGGCGRESEVFVGNTLEEECGRRGIRYIGSIGLDKEISRRSDCGEFVKIESSVFEAFYGVIREIKNNFCGEDGENGEQNCGGDREEKERERKE